MKYVNKLLGTLLIVSSGMWSLPHVANAVTLGNGEVAFAQPPRLVSTSTPYTDTSFPNPTYYFTVEVPATAGEPLQQLTFTQRSGTEDIEFQPKKTIAFIGTRHRQGQNLAVQTVRSDAQRQTVTVTFDSPVQPGQTVTIGLRPDSNPFYDGVYLFDVTAFPSGKQTAGQSLGVGRLQFYSDTTTES